MKLQLVLLIGIGLLGCHSGSSSSKSVFDTGGGYIQDRPTFSVPENKVRYYHQAGCFPTFLYELNDSLVFSLDTVRYKLGKTFSIVGTLEPDPATGKLSKKYEVWQMD